VKTVMTRDAFSPIHRPPRTAEQRNPFYAQFTQPRNARLYQMELSLDADARILYETGPRDHIPEKTRPD
jgi:hypothetical protein